MFLTMTGTLVLRDTGWALQRKSLTSTLPVPASGGQGAKGFNRAASLDPKGDFSDSIPKNRARHTVYQAPWKRPRYYSTPAFPGNALLRTEFPFNLYLAYKSGLLCTQRRPGFKRHSSKFPKQKTTHLTLLVTQWDHGTILK